MTISDWTDGERPREKLLRKGATALSDAELLAIILRVGTRNQNALELANTLLERFSGLARLMDCHLSELRRIDGVGPGKYSQLKAVLELSRRYLEGQMRKGKVFSNSKLTRDYLMSRLKGYPHEVFGCLFLDNRHKIISFEELFTGTISTAMVHPREVVRKALSHNAAAVIFCHNHPSGNPEPSDADRLLTERLCSTLELIEVRVLDHIVVGDGGSVSFAERGWL